MSGVGNPHVTVVMSLVALLPGKGIITVFRPAEPFPLGAPGHGCNVQARGDGSVITNTLLHRKSDCGDLDYGVLLTGRRTIGIVVVVNATVRDTC